jgi:hypothetical protein
VARLHLFELEDLPGFPRRLRDGLTDFLRVYHVIGGTADAAAPFVRRLLEETGETTVVDLASGGGGPARSLPRALARLGVPGVTCVLTDRYPNLPALRRAVASTPGLAAREESVDATRVPEDLVGVRTLFASFHHFRPAEARRILADCVARGRAIGVFEFTSRTPAALAMVLLTPVVQLLTAPLQRPFRWDRLVFTYLVPALPAAIAFDGLVSCLRSYSPDELRELARDLGGDMYRFEIGTTRLHPFGLPMTFVLGVPARVAGARRERGPAVVAPARGGSSRARRIPARIRSPRGAAPAPGRSR